MLKKAIQWFINLFRTTYQKEANTINRDITVNNKPNTINHIQELQQQLCQLTNAYNENINKLEQAYNKQSYSYENAYQAYSEVIKQKSTPEVELTEIKEKFIAEEEKLRDAWAELSKVQGYLHDDTLQILKEIESLQDTYTSELADSVKDKADKLQELRAEYLQTISDIGDSYRTALGTESVLKKKYQNAGIPHQATLSNMLGLKTKGLPVLLHDLTIEQVTVNNAMQGRLHESK